MFAMDFSIKREDFPHKTELVHGKLFRYHLAKYTATSELPCKFDPFMNSSVSRITYSYQRLPQSSHAGGSSPTARTLGVHSAILSPRSATHHIQNPITTARPIKLSTHGRTSTLCHPSLLFNLLVCVSIRVIYIYAFYSTLTQLEK